MSATNHKPNGKHRLRRRAVLGGLGAAALLARPHVARAQKVTELIVLTGVTPWLPAYQKVAAGYEKAAGVKVTLRSFPYAGMRTQMVNAIQSNNPVFDVFQLDESATGEFYDNAWVRPLDDIDPGYKIDPGIVTYDGLPFWNKSLRTATAQGGKVMGLPLNGNIDLFYYRKDLYEKLGLQVPRTWDEAIENGRKAQKAGVVKYGYVTRGQPTVGGQAITYEFMPVFYSDGAEWFADEGKNWTPTINSDAAKQAMATFRKLLELGPERPQTVGQADVIGLMQGGQTLQAHFVAAGAPQLEDPDRSAVVGKIGYAPLPAGSTGKNAPTSGTWSLAVPAGQTEDRQKAGADYIRWFMSKPQQEAFVRAGGIPTRDDVGASFGKSAIYLDAVAASWPNIRRSMRYVFANAMLDAVEPALAQMGSGDVKVDEGLDKLQAQVTEVVKKAGFLK
jgi:multiple sugar transport system substrate-binding protein